MAKTPAQLQIDALKRMKEARPRPTEDGAAAVEVPAASRTKTVRALPVGPETWRLLRERQRSTREFKGRLERGEWAARLLLALPPGAHGLDKAMQAELFALMRHYCLKKGLA